MDHPYSRTFTLTSLPNALADVAECAARARARATPIPSRSTTGSFGMIVRFKTQGGEAPVLRLLWRKEAGAWRITSYENRAAVNQAISTSILVVPWRRTAL